MQKLLYWPVTLCCLGLTGCSLGPKYETPCMDIPAEWHSDIKEGMNLEAPDTLVWWESLDDPLLNSLIQRAAKQNFDLQIAAARIVASRREYKGKSMDLFPHIDASVGGGHVYYSKEALVHGILFPTAEQEKNIKRNVNFFELGFDADWEIDLFGVTRHQLKAAEATMQAEEENLGDVWVTLSAEVARNYIDLRGFQERLNLLDNNIASQLDSVNLTEELLNIGTANAVDLSQAKEQLHMLHAQRPLLQLSIDKTIHRLSILLGSSPGDLFCELNDQCPLPCLPNNNPIGVPSDLLRRRPDIRKAERELAASNERISSAIASLFPRISLRGFIGDIGTRLPQLFNPASGTWFASPQLLLPIFNSRLIQQDIDFNKTQSRIALFNYQKTVLLALEETENSIATYNYEKERYFYLCQGELSAKEAYDLTLELYQSGVRNYLEVQIANRNLLAAQEACLQSRVDLLLHYIALYKALGGGWSCSE